MSSEVLTTESPRRPTRGILLTALQMIAPIIFAVVAGYGAVRYTEGATNQRLQSLETDSKTQRENLQHALDRNITRAEFQQFIEATRDDLREIKSDIRAIRSDLHR